jgi:hypothetical protein
MTNTVIPATQLFHSEVAKAQRLGFQLQVNLNAGQVTARMQPRTPSAHAACERATGKTNQAIEASQPVGHPGQTADCLREAIHSAVLMAKDVIA